VRTVVEQPRVSRAIDDAKNHWIRAGDAWEAATWAIIHDPEGGRPITESGATRSVTLEGARSIGMPTVTVLFEIRLFDIIVRDAFFEDARFSQTGRA
jgi:hypothetical protein